MALIYPTVKDTKKLAENLRQIDVLGQIATYFPVPGGAATRKVQYDFLDAPEAARIVEEYGMAAKRAEIISAAHEQLLITSEIEFLKREFEGNLGGNEGNLPALTVNKFAYNHQPVRTEYCLIQDARFTALEGILKISGSDTLEKPSTCETTAGTADDSSVIYTDNGQLTKMAPQTDMNMALRRLATMKMRKDNTSNPIMLLMHPIAAAIVESYNYATNGTGSATWEYSNESNMDYFRNHGAKILELECIDSDYAGADAGTTEFAWCMNWDRSFFIGVGKPIQLESWWENDTHTAYYARIAEALVPIALPLYKDSSDDYFKPVTWTKCKPWD